MLPVRVEIGESVILQKLNDEAILLDMATQQYYGLNDTGTRMWELLVSSGDPHKVVAQLQEDYSVPASSLEADLESLVEDLLRAGLLRCSAPVV